VPTIIDSAAATIAAQVELTTRDGTTHRLSTPAARGSPANPMSDAELSEKFRQCAAWGGLSPAQTQAVLDAVWKIETQASGPADRAK